MAVDVNQFKDLKETSEVNTLFRTTFDKANNQGWKEGYYALNSKPIENNDSFMLNGVKTPYTSVMVEFTPLNDEGEPMQENTFEKKVGFTRFVKLCLLSSKVKGNFDKMLDTFMKGETFLFTKEMIKETAFVQQTATSK